MHKLDSYTAEYVSNILKNVDMITKDLAPLLCLVQFDTVLVH
jgi:hypothetical protein